MNFLSILPVTAVVAILIFVAKEIVEAFRRHSANNRKRAALKQLIANECELNHWTLKSIRIACKTIQEEVDEGAEFSLVFTTAKKVHFRCKRPNRGVAGHRIPDVHQELMAKLLLDVAALDEALFSYLQEGCEAAAELEHLRDSLIDYLSPSEEQHIERRAFLEGFVDYALKELDDIYQKMAKLYRECTGKDLSAHKLR